MSPNDEEFSEIIERFLEVLSGIEQMKLNPRHYILVDHRPVIEPNLLKWARWFDKASQRIVSRTQIGNIQISTLFLGLDHNFSGQGPPIFWETMIFGGPYDRKCFRCAGTWEQAEAQHARLVNMVECLPLNAKDRSLQ